MRKLPLSQILPMLAEIEENFKLNPIKKSDGIKKRRKTNPNRNKISSSKSGGNRSKKSSKDSESDDNEEEEDEFLSNESSSSEEEEDDDKASESSDSNSSAEIPTKQGKLPKKNASSLSPKSYMYKGQKVRISLPRIILERCDSSSPKKRHTIKRTPEKSESFKRKRIGAGVKSQATLVRPTRRKNKQVQYTFNSDSEEEEISYSVAKPKNKRKNVQKASVLFQDVEKVEEINPETMEMEEAEVMTTEMQQPTWMELPPSTVTDFPKLEVKDEPLETEQGLDFFGSEGWENETESEFAITPLL